MVAGFFRYGPDYDSYWAKRPDTEFTTPPLAPKAGPLQVAESAPDEGMREAMEPGPIEETLAPETLAPEAQPNADPAGTGSPETLAPETIAPSEKQCCKVLQCPSLTVPAFYSGRLLYSTAFNSARPSMVLLFVARFVALEKPAGTRVSRIYFDKFWRMPTANDEDSCPSEGT